MNKRALMLAAALLAGAAARAAKDPGFPAPQGVTLLAGAEGLSLAWDPILRNDLMGYSIWIRKKGERDYTRVRIPVKVGKEMKRQPLTTRARFRFPIADNGGIRLKNAAQGLHAELVVRAEYEEGKSPRSVSVFTQLAADQRPEMSDMEDPADGDKDTLSGENKGEAARGEAATPFSKRPVGERDRLLLPRGRWAAGLGLEYEARALQLSGRDPLQDLGFVFVPGFDLTVPVQWEIRFIRNYVTVPLTLRYGLTQGIEVGLTGRYRLEEPTADQLVADGVPFGDSDRISSVDGRRLSDLSSSGLGDSTVHLKVQPVLDAPLLLGLDIHIPTGRSRFESWIRSEYFYRETESFAGNGSGVTRLHLSVQYGMRAVQKGLYLFGGFSPAATERFSIDNVLEYQAVHPDLLEAGVGYTFPWTVLGRPGAGMAGAKIRAKGASSTQGGFYFFPAEDGSPAKQNRYWQGDWENGTGLNPYGDTQIEFFLESDQETGYKVGGNGRLFFRLKSRGWDAGISGLLVY